MTRRSDGGCSRRFVTAADELALERRLEPGSGRRSLALAGLFVPLLAVPCLLAPALVMPGGGAAEPPAAASAGPAAS